MTRETKIRTAAIVAVLSLIVFTVGSAIPTKPKRPFGYGIYGGGPPYFEGYQTITPVPEPACFCVAGVCILAIAIIRKKLKKK